MRKSYCNISSTNNATLEKTSVATKNFTATSEENLLQQRKKAKMKHLEELLCNIRETPVAATKKRYCCNIPHHLLQHRK
jgi:hypothetical protein